MSLRIWVTVKPRSMQDSVKAVADGTYQLTVRAPPHKGEANRAIIEILAEHFSVPKSSIKILRGHTSKKKLIEVG